MQFTAVPSAPLRWLPAACLLAAVLAFPLHGQIPALKKAIDGPATIEASPAGKPDEIRARFEHWRKEARDTLQRMEAPGASTNLPKGVTTEEFNDLRRNLEQMILAITRAVKNLTDIAEARKELESTRAKDAAWTGFKEKPPYSLLLIDELLNERDAIQANLDSSESSFSNYESLILNIMGETRTTEDAVSRAIVAVQQASADSLEAAKWHLDAARAKSRLMAIRASLLQSGRDSLKDRIDAAKTELSLLDRQLKIARSNCRFTDDDLAKIGKISEERQQALRKEIETSSKRLNAALSARTQAQAALDALPGSGTASAEAPERELAKYRLEVADDRVDAIQTLIEGQESLILLENITLSAYQNRRGILTATNPKDRATALAAIGNLRERLWAWLNVVDDAMANTSAALNKLESRAISISSEDPRFKLLNEQRAITSEKFAMLQRVLQAVNFQRKLVKRWDIEYSDKPAAPGLTARMGALGTTGWHALSNIWSFELMRFEDKVVVDGQTITGKFPVSLGMLVRALLFFLIGYWVSARIANRIEATVVTRGHLAEAQARTLRNWAMIVVGVLLAIGTLSYLNIPLTVFAFFGGALAIGLGFGMQTLIKNFISGIIVLAERKVRVGDTLDVDGIIGTVTEINTRSSVIRSPDDVETMIPNSLFLENRVTNWTLTNRKIRRNLRVSVAYGTPPTKVMEILTDAAGRHGLICKNPAPFAVFDDFGESALIFSLYFWLELNGVTNAMIVSSDLRLIIEKRFTETGVDVPFPKRDLHLRADSPLHVHWSKKPGEDGP